MAGPNQELPPELVQHVVEMCGGEGERWIGQLPSLIARLEGIWNVSVEPPFAGVEFNYVAPATAANGEPVVVKIAPPFENSEIFTEAKFLRERRGKGCVRLLAEDMELRALLIERAVPGAHLADEFAGREAEALMPAIDVLRDIVSEVPSEMSDVILLDDWFDGLRRHAGTTFPASYATQALEMYASLSHDTRSLGYLHGDFHPGNILTATRSPYLAIDPKGIVGHLGYDLAVFLNNFHWWQEGREDIRQRLANAVELFSSAFALPAIELRQWAFAQMVLSAWWMFDEMPGLYANEVEKADIWDV